ncbi:MAG: hypothetical protein SGPRY_004954 [Prymnesium sp.]
MSSIATSQEAITSPRSAAFAPTAAIVAAPEYEAQERAGDLRLDGGWPTIELAGAKAIRLGQAEGWSLPCGARNEAAAGRRRGDRPKLLKRAPGSRSLET